MLKEIVYTIIVIAILYAITRFTSTKTNIIARVVYWIAWVLIAAVVIRFEVIK